MKTKLLVSLILFVALPAFATPTSLVASMIDQAEGEYQRLLLSKEKKLLVEKNRVLSRTLKFEISSSTSSEDGEQGVASIGALAKKGIRPNYCASDLCVYEIKASQLHTAKSAFEEGKSRDKAAIAAGVSVAEASKSREVYRFQRQVFETEKQCKEARVNFAKSLEKPCIIYDTKSGKPFFKRALFKDGRVVDELSIKQMKKLAEKEKCKIISLRDQAQNIVCLSSALDAKGMCGADRFPDHDILCEKTEAAADIKIDDPSAKAVAKPATEPAVQPVPGQPGPKGMGNR